MLRLDRVEGGIVIEVVLEVGGQDGLMRGARGVGRARVPGCAPRARGELGGSA